MNAIFVDSNVLLYCYDRRAGDKQRRAIETVARLGELGTGRLSVQCLAEFYYRATRAHETLLTPEEAEGRVAAYVQSWTVFDLTPEIVAQATRTARQHRLNYWDAQIWAAARLNQVEVVFSEGFAAGSSLEGVRFVNPFAAEFELARWI